MKKYLVVGFAIPVFIIAALYSFRVTHINCTMEGENCSQDLEAQLASVKGSSLFFTLFHESISHSISDETVLVTEIKKELPNTVTVSLTKEKPVYILGTPEKKYTVYASGIFHEHPADSNTAEYHTLHLEFPFEKIVEESHIRADYHSELTNISLSLYNQPFSLQNSNWKDTQTIQFELASGVGVLLPIVSADKKIEQLKLILDSPELETVQEPLAEIDLRYKYPVLRTTQ